MSDLSIGEDVAVEDIDPSALWNLLGIPDEATPTERVRLLLQQLDLADYLPPPAWYAVLELLAQASPDGAGATWLSRPSLSREFEDRLRTEIDQLATRFWNIPPADRLSQWNGLAQRSGCWPSLRARLRLLEPGLALESIVIDETGDELASRLAQLIAQLFPLDAASRGRLIGDVLGSMIDKTHAWEEAAHQLSSDRPEIAQLVPEFLAAVTTLCDREREESLRCEARIRETDEDAEWDSENGWYDSESPQTTRIFYCILGAIVGIPLLLQIFGLIAGLAKPERPTQKSPNAGTVNETQVDPMRRAEKALRNKVPSPADTRGDSVE